MIRLFTSLWYYGRLSLESISFYRLSLTRPLEENDINQFVHKAIPLIEQCGCVCVKFAQWVTPILDALYNEIDHEPYWLKKLEKFYEQCQDHSLEYTYQIYKEDYKEDFHTKYIMKDIVGSGSVGQVYKITDKYTGMDYALKVLHPNVYFDMWFMKTLIHLLLWIPYTRIMIYHILPFNIHEFIELFETQIDMIHEANNLSQMKYLHKDNSMIIIPALLKCGPHSLLMSYEEGDSIDETNRSEYDKYKSICLLSLFVRNSLEVNNFIHGDIHKGNWKLRGNKLVIYDFGFCWSIHPKDNYLNQNIFTIGETTTKDDISNITTYMCYTLNCHTERIKASIQEYYKNPTNTFTDPVILFKIICRVAIHNNLLIPPNNILGIIMIIQTQKYWTKYSLNNENEQFETNEYIFRNLYLNNLSLCQTYDIFPELQSSFKTTLNKQQVPVNELFDIVDQSKGITDEVRSLLTFE